MGCGKRNWEKLKMDLDQFTHHDTELPVAT